jgi:hypothetical protein
VITNALALAPNNIATDDNATLSVNDLINPRTT